MTTWLQWWRRDHDLIYVDVEDYLRKRAIREAEFQQAVQAESTVQRVSGDPRNVPTRRLPGITEIVREALR